MGAQMASETLERNASKSLPMGLSDGLVKGGQGTLYAIQVFGIEVSRGALGRAGRQALQGKSNLHCGDERHRKQGVDDRVDLLPLLQGAGQITLGDTAADRDNFV